MEEFPVSLYDARRPDEVYVVSFYTVVLPRTGDYVHYYVDYPHHMPNGHKCAEGEPISVSGRVAKVEIQYRRNRYGGKQSDRTYVMLHLDEYKAELPPEEKAK